MALKGEIRNPQSLQVNNFSGLRWGNITPTDFDGFLDFRGRVFVLIELKHSGVDMDYGQQLAFERAVDRWQMGGVSAWGLLVVHDTPWDGISQVDVAVATVVRCRRRRSWYDPKEPICVRDAIDRILKVEGISVS